ncbi:hypothetical protein C0Q70_01131 [Pomacea canaliculata]|uniref:Band 7 domain-containing protein n=1 Tax=Pomacea canaliculata TaxID=400727 RepID=A0A2T7PYL2_POMCA|nr:hypothetical protein C0Q70_01131 [Pomacea canaliculata]
MAHRGESDWETSQEEVDEDNQKENDEDEDEDKEEKYSLMHDNDREADSTSDGLSSEEMKALSKMHSGKKKYVGEGKPEESLEMFPISYSEELVQPSPSLPFSASRVSQTECIELHEVEATIGDLPFAASDFVDSPTSSAEVAEQDAKQTPRKIQQLQNVIYTFFTRRSPVRLAVFSTIVVVVVGLLIFVSILPASFVYVEYYELALARSYISGRVNRERTYYPGCYLLTPDTDLIRFEGTAHFLDLALSVSTSDRLSFGLNVTLQYFIKPEELGDLYRDFEDNYRDTVKAITTSTIKNEAVKFSLDEYRLNRSFVEERFKSVIFDRLGGNCCRSCCPWHCAQDFDCRSCVLHESCQSGMHMEMRHFQMGAVDIPDTISEHYLRQVILQIEAETEHFVQEHLIETKHTEQMKQNILSDADENVAAAELQENATAYSNIIRVATRAQYEKEVQLSYMQAMKDMYSRLNITQEEHKLSLMFLRALEIFQITCTT